MTVLAFVYSKVPVSVQLKDLLARWPAQCRKKDMKRRMKLSFGGSTELKADVACVSMLAHPIVDDKINRSKVIHIMCVDTGYTIYKRDDKLGETWRLATTDTYDLKREVEEGVRGYTEIKASPVTFFNASDAHAAIADKYVKVRRGTEKMCDFYSNSHEHIDQFVYHTMLVPCVGDMCQGKGWSITYFDGRPLCFPCRPNEREKGRNAQPPHLFDLSRLSDDTKPLKKNCYIKPGMVDEEYVTFMQPFDLPFVKDDDEKDDAYMRQFLRECKSVVYDIETITVDGTLRRNIPDEIVTITASLCSGTSMKKLAMFTRKKPDSWGNEEETIDTNWLLRDLPGKSTLPPLTVVQCKGEEALVNAFQVFLTTSRPHYIVSYNGHGFDHKFLIRASAAAATQYKYPGNPIELLFHEKLNHFAPEVKTSVTDPLAKISPFAFKRPNGANCKGLISDGVMEVGYNTFTSMTSIDLMAYHNNSTLADACASRGVEEGKMEGVSHSQIPKLYHNKDEKFFVYAVQDVIATTNLYFKSRFDALEVFVELEKLVCSPPSISMSGHKTVTAKTTSYVQYMAHRFLREAQLRPKRVLGNAIVDELSDYFCGDAPPKLSESIQLIADFSNGNCKCNTLFKALPELKDEITDSSVKEVLVAHLKIKAKKRDSKERQYSTVDALLLLFYITRGDVRWDPFRSLIADFTREVGGDHKKVDLFKNFISYLVNVRRCLSPFNENPSSLWKEYKDNYNVDSCRTDAVERYWKIHAPTIIDLVRSKGVAFKRSLKITSQTLSKVIKEIAGSGSMGIKPKMLPFNGAINICPEPTMIIDRIVSVVDFQSLYPNVILKINMGQDTHVSVSYALQCAEAYKVVKGLTCIREAATQFTKEYLTVNFTRRCDDEENWVNYIDYPEYLDRNCILFIKNITAVQNHQFKLQIVSRVRDKEQAANSALSKEERNSYGNRSLTKKTNINGFYGTIGTTINPRFQPTVTGGGRREIINIVHVVEGDKGCKVIYGDTDSAFYLRERFDVFKMAEMPPEELYALMEFSEYGVSLGAFLTDIYGPNYPVDVNDVKAVKVCAGKITFELDKLIAAELSSRDMTLEAEKTLAGIILPCPKKYSSYNCCTDKKMTKGMSSHNKASIPMTRTVLEMVNDIAIKSKDKWEFARDLYDQLGKLVIVPIELDLVEPKDIARSSSFDLSKVNSDSKKGSLIKSLERDGVHFIYEKIKTLQVPIYPEGSDEGWSLCDVTNQSCSGKVHLLKVKFAVLSELLGIMKIAFAPAVCELFQAMIWGEFYPDRYSSEDFKDMNDGSPGKFRPMSFESINKRYGGINNRKRPASEDLSAILQP